LLSSTLSYWRSGRSSQHRYTGKPGTAAGLLPVGKPSAGLVNRDDRPNVMKQSASGRPPAAGIPVGPARQVIQRRARDSDLLDAEASFLRSAGLSWQCERAPRRQNSLVGGLWDSGKLLTKPFISHAEGRTPLPPIDLWAFLATLCAVFTTRWRFCLHPLRVLRPARN
jgi:hypothetical protein